MLRLSPQSLLGTADQDFREFDLNEVYSWYRKDIPDPRKPEQIQSVLRLLEIDYRAFGGYGENRKDVWAETYMKLAGKFFHLGIDINAPAGTKVYAPFDAFVVNRFTDKDTKIGWGGRLILSRDGKKNLVLAHLDPRSLTDKKTVQHGEYLGTVGTWPTNGNTFEHLHVQVIKHKNFDKFDGYGFEADLKDNPNPFNVNF